MRVLVGAAVLLGLALANHERHSSAADFVLQAANEAAAEINRRTPVELPHYVVESAEVGPGRRFTYRVTWTSKAIPTTDPTRFAQVLEPEVVRSVCASTMKQISDAGWSIHYLYSDPNGPAFAEVNVRPGSCSGNAAALPLRARIARTDRSFKGYACTDDCQGHEAGYQWAEDQGISDPAECDSNSASFNEGCEAAAHEGYELEQEEIHETFQDARDQY